MASLAMGRPVTKEVMPCMPTEHSTHITVESICTPEACYFEMPTKERSRCKEVILWSESMSKLCQEVQWNGRSAQPRIVVLI